jgi:16S rRNA (cytidine1402-2'-O)-methyltransferase
MHAGNPEDAPDADGSPPAARAAPGDDDACTPDPAETPGDPAGTDPTLPPPGPAWRRVTLPPGLHLVATPIGTARDITLRALDTLASADLLAAEDTRTLRHLMALHGVPLAGRSVVAYHDHNGAAARPALLAALAAGRSIAYASEAGTPLVADPGFALARAAIAEGHRVHAVPGASAALAALSVAGLPSDRFLFAGFLPPQQTARRRALESLADVQATLILFESPKRVRETLGDMVLTLGSQRQAALCRELTKRFETVIRTSLADLYAAVAEAPPRGECVLVVDRGAPAAVTDDTLDDALTEALAQGSLRAAAQVVADRLGLPRRQVYQRALALQEKEPR